MIAKTDTDYLRFVKHQSETLIGILLPQISGWNMMKRGDHPNRTARHRNVRPTFEKTVHNLCPNCGSSEFTVYFESGSPRKVGALCYSCGTVGFFARNNFFELGRVSKGTKLTSSHRIARIAGR